ncbi:hypothetical protein [Kosakonia oryziphila]|uniref:Uncharacterized protein n=1 Tax=Kosakonia oryziphila TaxID=1005667 RepID=A0A1C4GCS3_9ENTR|nr:hypothetical protein [Kosakonia oryziphila]SCC65625.1 hypothetical protein GA0061070_106111 [Kosakonia oryziphila]
MSWENYSRRQLLMLVAVFNVCSWALIISGIDNLRSQSEQVKGVQS